MNFKLIPVKDRREYDRGKQEYIKVGYEGHDHLPIVFRVHLKGCANIYHLGIAPFTYGFIWLDNFYKIMNMDGFDYVWFARRCLETYFHEFLHCYFLTRLEKKDMISYPKLKSKSWGWNERIVINIAERLNNLFLFDHGDEWIKLFEELDSFIKD